METKEKSEKKVLEINYKGSGVKTLSGFGTLFYILAAISFIIAFLSLFLDLLVNSNNIFLYTIEWIKLYAFWGSLFLALGHLFFGALCKGLSTIAKGALYQMSVVEKTFYVHLPQPLLDEDDWQK